MAQSPLMMQGMNNLNPDAKKFAQASRKPSAKVFRRILKYTGRQKKILFPVIVLAIIGCACEILAPYFVADTIDLMIGTGLVDMDGILRLVLLLLGLYGVSTLFLWIVSYFSGIIAASVAAEIRKDGFAHISRMALRFYDTRSHGDILSRFINDTDAIADGLLQGILQVFTSGVTIVGSLVLMAVISWQMLFLIVPAAGITFLLAMLLMKFTSRFFRGQQLALGKLAGLTEEVFSGQREVRAFSYEGTAQARFEAVNQELYRSGQKAQFASSLPNPVTRFLNYLVFILIVVFGWSLGGLSVGQISGFVLYWNLFSKPLNDFTNISSQIMAAFAAAERVFEVLDMEPEADDPEDAVVLLPEDVKGEVVFEDVDFAYGPEKPLIRDFSLAVKPGQRIAIVGPTGAGKTTIINLLMRFYEPDSGVIRLDGYPVTQLKISCLRRSFGMVLQESWLLHASVKENLMYGNPEAAMEEVVEACKAVRAHGFISRLENGYDTMIAENAENLSAGQKQLLTIARAMIAKPAMLILDEATSSVDTLTEQRIQEAFALLMEGRTSFVIAHRLSTIRGADRILVLRDGQIVEQGTHEELLAKKDFYFTLYNSQFSHGSEILGEEKGDCS